MAEQHVLRFQVAVDHGGLQHAGDIVESHTLQSCTNAWFAGLARELSLGVLGWHLPQTAQCLQACNSTTAFRSSSRQLHLLVQAASIIAQASQHAYHLAHSQHPYRVEVISAMRKCRARPGHIQPTGFNQKPCLEELVSEHADQSHGPLA